MRRVTNACITVECKEARSKEASQMSEQSSKTGELIDPIEAHCASDGGGSAPASIHETLELRGEGWTKLRNLGRM